MATATRRTVKAAPEPVEEFEEEFEETTEDDDLEELEEDEPTPAPKPTKRAKATATTADGDKPKRQPPVRPVIEFGSPWLAAYITENTTETYDARGIRMLLRKLAADGKLKREVGVDRARYEFTGPDDVTVKQVLAMVQSGEAKALKQAGLQKVKNDAAAKRKAKAAAKAKAAPVEEDDDEDDDEVEEAPAPKPRRTAAKAPAPAKATPATARRRTAAAK